MRIQCQVNNKQIWAFYVLRACLLPRAKACTALASALSQPLAATVPFSEPWSPSTPAPKRDWASLLQGAQLVPGVTGKTIDGRYTGKAPEAQFVEQAQVV